MFTINHNDVKITIMVKWEDKIHFIRHIVISYFISTIALSNEIALLLQQRMVRMAVQVVIALAPADDCSHLICCRLLGLVRTEYRFVKMWSPGCHLKKR